MIVKLQDGVELGEGWKRISVKSIIPVTGNEVNIGKKNLYPTTGGNVRNRTGEPAAEMTDTSRGGIFPDGLISYTAEQKDNVTSARTCQRQTRSRFSLCWWNSFGQGCSWQHQKQRGTGFPPGMVIFAWQPEATEGEEAQVRVWILQFPVDPREAERSPSHPTVLQVYLQWHKTTYWVCFNHLDPRYEMQMQQVVQCPIFAA